MFRLAKYLKSYKLQLILGPLCKLIEAILELLVPLVTADIIDNGVRNGDMDYVLSHGALMIGMGALGLCFALVCQKSASIASQGFGTKLRNAMFRHINTLSHAELDKIGTASLITRMTNDINRLQLAVAMLIRLVIRAPFLIIGAIVMSFLIDVRLAMIFAVAAPVTALVLYLVMRASIPYFRGVQGGMDRVSLIARENLSGNRVIRAFNKQKEDRERFADANETLTDITLKGGRISTLLNPLSYIIAQAAIIAIVWFGSGFVYTGDVTTGQIIALVNYMTLIQLTMIVVSDLVVIFTRAAVSASRVNEIFDTKPGIVECYDPVSDFCEDEPAVCFSDVTFSYEGQGSALTNISFTANRGETIGIIGGTGAGKSTLVNLIPRFYDASEGTVTVFGRDVRTCSFSALRGMIGIVPQKAELFSGTIRSNLERGKPGATDEEIAHALSVAQASEFVCAMPMGYDSIVSAGGTNLSGGQRQRLTIARAVIKQPDILILDDSASALDFATDAALRRALSHETGNMTVFMVSQRVGTVRYADKIIVLDAGELVGLGTHRELIKACPVYREICLSQLRREEVEEDEKD